MEWLELEIENERYENTDRSLLLEWNLFEKNNARIWHMYRKKVGKNMNK